MNNVRYAVARHHSNNQWAIYKYGKVVKFYHTKEEAQEEMARYIEDDQWNAANRD